MCSQRPYIFELSKNPFVRIEIDVFQKKEPIRFKYIYN